MSAPVDAIIVTYNHAPTLAAVLAGLAAQELRPKSVILIDNASTDGTVVITNDWRARLPLEVVVLPINRGFSAAVNEGVRRSTAPWILSLNPDCRLEPGYLAQLVSAANPRPMVGTACGLLVRAAGISLAATRITDSAGMIVSGNGRHHDRGSGRPLHSYWLRPAWVFGASGAAALYRRAALEDIAYPCGEVFDERFFAYREDADLAWRLQRRGWSCLYWPAARAAHARGLQPERGRRGTKAINRLSVRNRFLLRLGNADWRWHLACFPWWLIRDLMVVTGALTLERSSWPGVVEAWQLRHAQRARGQANTRRATVSGWQIARWFLPGGRVRKVVA